jgi:hypothetical protein
MDQTQRRVLKGESVPAAEKIVSIFGSSAKSVGKNPFQAARLG